MGGLTVDQREAVGRGVVAIGIKGRCSIGATLANAEYRDSILLEAVAGIEEATIIREVYIGTSATTYAIRGYLLL